MHIQPFEIANIKRYIRKLVIKSVINKSEDKESTQIYLCDSSQLSLFKRHICVSNQEIVFIKNYDPNNNLVLHVSDISDLITKLTESEINEYLALSIDTLFNDIHEHYIEVLNINPFDMQFKNMEMQTDPFDFTCAQKYRSIYESL